MTELTSAPGPNPPSPEAATKPKKKRRKKRKLPAWTQGPVYGVVRAISATTQIAGIGPSMRAMRVVGGAFAEMPFNRGRLQRAIENISWCFPEWNEEIVREHAVEAYRHLSMLTVEMGAAPRLLTEDGYAAYVEIGDLRKGLLAMLSGRPCVMVTGHCGNWELLGYTLALLGFPMHAVYRPLDSKPLDAWVKETRTRRGLTLIDKFGAARALPPIVAAGAPVGFIADQNAGDRGLFVPFFDRMASAYKAIGLLAMQHDAVVICGQARRLSGIGAEAGGASKSACNSQLFRYRIEVADVFTSEDWASQPDPLFYITARYRRAIEIMVRRAPEQYLWMHRYWKSRPAFERAGKGIPDKLHEKIAQLPWMAPAALERLTERAERDAAGVRASEGRKPGLVSVIAPAGVPADTSPPAAPPGETISNLPPNLSPELLEELAKTRQILLVRTSAASNPDDDEAPREPAPGELLPLGRMCDVIEALRDFNTAPDGGKDSVGVLFGPGFAAQLPMVGPNDDVGQVLVSIGEDEIAWPVLFNICNTLKWKLMDPQSGRMFG